jgi:amidase
LQVAASSGNPAVLEGALISGIEWATATELTAALVRREVSSRELLATYLDRADRLSSSVNALVTVDESAVVRAAAADEALARGEVWGPLHGLPVTVKDSLETAGLRTTAGAPEYAHHVPDRDAVAVARLRAAGAIVFAKTNLPPYAGDYQTHNPIFGATRNPWNLERAVGGSSGGSAAAIAAGISGLDLGSDLAGSIRIPAAYCGVFGLRPSYGIIPTRGHVPGPPGSLAEADVATVGPLARGAADLDLALSVLAGPDTIRAVAWRLELPTPRASALTDYRIAVWLDDEFCPIDTDVLRVLGNNVDAVDRAGARIDPGARPCSLRDATGVAQQHIQATISGAYPSEEYERLRVIAEAADPEDESAPVRRARDVTASVRAYGLAREARAQLEARFAEFFTHFDVLLCPVTPSTAIPHDHEPDMEARRIVVNGLSRPYRDQAVWSSLAGVVGLPAVVLPAGLAADGLPVGLQVIGAHLQDRTVISVAAHIAQLNGGFLRPSALH